MAIARSILSNPKIIFADEPTGNLDKKTALETLKLLIESSKKFGQTLIIVTHDLEVARMSEMVITIEEWKGSQLRNYKIFIDSSLGLVEEKLLQ